MYKIFLVLFFASMICVTPSHSVEGMKGNHPEYVSGEILVKFNDEVAEEAMVKIFEGLEMKILEKGPLPKFYRLRIPEGMTVEEAIAKLRKYPEVKYSEPNYILRIQ